MALIGRLQVTKEIKSPGNVFAETLYGSKKKILPKICPERITALELLEGSLGELGCTISVHYQMANGETLISTERIVAVDAKNMSKTYDFVGGLKKLYKSFKINAHMESQCQKTFLVFTYEYEKQTPDVPDPDGIVNLLDEIANIVDAYILNDNNNNNNKASPSES